MADYLTTDTELTSIANAIRLKGGTSEALTYPQDFITAINNIETGGGNYSLQAKTVTPTKSQQSVTADSGYYGLSGVTVNAIPEAYQNVSSVTATASDVLSPKVIVDAEGTTLTGTMANNGAVTRTLDATTGNQSYTIPTGYHNGNGTVSISLENKTVTPTTSEQNITPTTGKVLGKVTINPIPDNGASIAVEPLSVTQNGTYTAPSGTAYSPVSVNVSGGGGSVGKKQVNFIDYDGTILYSYTAAEANALTALPENPSHAGLVAQGWNWTLAQIKSQLASTPEQEIWVGQMYITASGNTEIDVSMPEGRLSPILTICPNGTLTVDWGDNTTPDTVTGTSETTREAVPHTYAQAGNYTITISVVSGSFSFYGAASSNSSYLLLRKGTKNNENRVYANCVQAIRLGSGITSIGEYAFAYCSSLTNITIPDGVTSISGYAFFYCYSLASITIPDSVTSIENNVFFNCYSLNSVMIPDGVTSISGYAFSNCYALTSVTISDGVTSIGSQAFNYCYSLASITIPDSVTSIGSGAFYACYSLASVTISDGVTSIGSQAFYACYSLASITIPDSVTSIGNGAFYYCYSLASITIPDSVTSIEYSAFFYCYSLASITIPGSVTSIGNGAFSNCCALTSVTISDGVTSIGSQVFNYCYSLASITIPDSVTSISGGAFQNCYGMSKYYLLSTTPPTLANANAFGSIPSDCVIYVPQGCLEAYKTATNWSKYASYMQEKP